MAITYTPTTNFGSKDSLPTNDPDKVIKGSEFTTEFTAIQTAFGLAAPAASPTFTGTVTISSVDINGGAIDGTTIGGTTPAAGTFSSLTATTADINGGTIDGVTIGGSSAGAITGTTGQFNTSLNVDGTVTADGLTVDGNSTFTASTDGTPILILESNNAGGTEENTLQFKDLGALAGAGQQIGKIEFYSSDATSAGVAGYISVLNTQSSTGEFYFGTGVGGSAVDRLNIASNGDISFYEDTGTTPKFFWDASAEALGIGTTSPASPLEVVGSSAGASLVTGRLRNSGTTSGTGATLALMTNTNSTAGVTLATLDAVSDNTTGGGYFTIRSSSPTGNLLERLRITSAGNVGIGTSSPDTLMELVGDNPILTIRDVDTSSATATATIRFAESGASDTLGNYWDVGYSPVNGLAFAYMGSEAMRIDASGNLLVGQSTSVNPGAGNTIVGAAVNGFGLASFSRDGNLAATFNRNTSDGSLVGFYKDGTSVGSIGAYTDELTIGTGDVGLWFNAPGDYVGPFNTTTGAFSDNAISIGGPSARFKDLYLSGGVYLGGTTSANLLDDYEEGAFVSSLTPGTSGSITLNSSFDELVYTKIGRLVTITGRLTVASVASPVGTIINVALPFTAFGAAAQSCGGAVWKNTETAAIPIDVTGGSSTAVIRFDPSTLSTNQYFNFSFSYTAA